MPLGKLQSQLVQQLQTQGRLTYEQVDTITRRPDEISGEELDKLLNGTFAITSIQLLVAKARAYNLAPFFPSRFRITKTTFERLPLDFCKQNICLPVGFAGDFLLLAVASAFEISVSQKASELCGKRVVRLLARESELREKLFVDQSSSSGFDDVVSQIDVDFAVEEKDSTSDDVTEESAPIVQLANRIIEDAYFSGTSDIHIEPWEKNVIVRYRIDGVCQEKLRLPQKVGPALIARLKIMCNLDIAERRLPQDGRIVFKQYTKKSIDIDLRVSTAPLNYGEGMVMRILDKQKSTLPLPALGFSDANLEKYRECIRQPYGMILHCGPTGSGKSMTLYSALGEINSPEIVIRTAEDPIEYTLAGVNQMQMHRQIGLTFASALRAYLRQDPDVILVGEIRDKETAGIAVEAALTGHLLISTLHTNDAPSTVARLTDMGIEPFMISSSLLCVCAQRLMRRVCKTCRVQYEPEGREKDILQNAIGW